MAVALLDPMGSLDSDRIAALLEYFEPDADYLLVALLPEEAALSKAPTY